MNEVNNGMNPLNQNPNQVSGNDTNNQNPNMNFINGNMPNNYPNYNNQTNNMNDILNNGQQVNSYSTNTVSQNNLENQPSSMNNGIQLNNDMNYMNGNMSNNYSVTDSAANSINDITTNQSPMTSRMDKYNTTNLDNSTNDLNTNMLNSNQTNNMNNNMMENNSTNDMNNDIPISVSSLQNSEPVTNNQNITPTNNNQKQKDDTDAYFADAKKKGFPVWIIFVILLLAVIGGGVYYFMVIDTPQNIFKGLLDSKLFGIKLEAYEQSTIDFEGNVKLMSSDEDMKQVFDIINKISVKGSIGEDYKNKTFFLNLEPSYESKKLLGINAYYENSNIYLESKDIYDKVLKSELPEETVEMINQLFENENKEDVETIISSLKKSLSSALENVQNKKEYVKLDKNYVKKVSILIEAQTLADVYKSLANDSDFLSSLSKLTETPQSDIKESLEDEIEYIEEYQEDYGPIKISLYLSIITNKFYKAEIIDEEVMITVEQEDDVFSYKLYDEDDIIQLEGSFSLVKNNKNDYSLFYSIDVIEEQISMEFNIDYSVKYNEDIQKVATTDAVDINNLSDADTNKILTNISENENINKFAEDISAIFSYMTTGDEDYLA